jgi:hypothetical protein
VAPRCAQTPDALRGVHVLAHLGHDADAPIHRGEGVLERAPFQRQRRVGVPARGRAEDVASRDDEHGRAALLIADRACLDEAREDHNYPNKYPLQNDRYHVAFNKPVHMLRPVDGAHIDEVARYGFNRLGYEAKQRYAFAPAENYVPFNPAIGAGHGWGTGPKGNFPHEDLDESLGGGYVAVIKAAPGVYRR